MLGVVVKDRGANVRSAGEQLVGDDDAGDSIHCAAHLTKSVVDAVVLNAKSKHYHKEMGRDVDLLLKVAAYIRGSDDARRVFKNSAPAEIAHLEPLKDNPTRWEGIDICISRALRMKPSWQAFCNDPKARAALLLASNQEESDFPSDVFFGRVAVYKKLLEPLRTFSKTCQKMDEALMPQLIFIVARVEESYVARGEDAATAALRARFAAAVKEHLVPLVRGTTVATKAALLSPESVDLERYLTNGEIEENWKEIKREALLLLTTNDNLDLAKAAKMQCKAHVAMARARLTVASALPARPKWTVFWDQIENEVVLLVPIVRLYMSMPISSVKPETVFSYAGEVVTKKTASWDVSSVEAMVLLNDFTRQADFSFDIVLKEIEALEAQRQEHRKEEAARARAERKAQREAVLLALAAEDDEDEVAEAVGDCSDVEDAERMSESE